VAKALLLLMMMEATTRLSLPLAFLKSATSVVEVRSSVSHTFNLLRVLKSLTLCVAEPVEDDGMRRRKKRNRWGDAQENKAAGLMGLPTMIMANMTNEQLEAYTLHLRIEEISQKLRINDVVPADGDR